MTLAARRRAEAHQASSGLRLAGLCAAGMCLAAGCQERGVDLLRAEHARLARASSGGLGERQARAAAGRPRRIRDVVRASLPASPPSRYRFVTDVPSGGRLFLAAGIPGRHRGGSAVEFVVSVGRRGHEQVVISELLDPANHGTHRNWVPLEADLSGYAGRGVEIVLETRGANEEGVADRAFWGTPTIATSGNGRPPLVIVYLVDALRADHLSLYGYGRDTSPQLVRFAKDGVVFDQAIASSSWTKPSVASLFTSLLPRDHRCVQFFSPLDPKLVTLAERMRDHGYGTGGVLANPLVASKDKHFDQGFAYFSLVPLPRRAAQVVDAALDFVDARRGRPTFVYVHTMDSHAPYLPPPPFDRRFEPHPEPGRRASEPPESTAPGDVERIVAQYDGTIAYGDQQFGRFLSGLRERGLYDRATIVFLADHGEEFLDHGAWIHGHTLFDELVRVPLVVKYPDGRGAGRRVARQVQLLDVLPTLLESVELPVPAGIAGRAIELAGHDLAERPAILETNLPAHVAYGVRTSAAKYVRVFHPGSSELFFDLRHDPGEERGLVLEPESPGHSLRRLVEAAVGPSTFFHRLRVDGKAAYELRFRTTGRFESVERTDLVPAERAEVADGGRLLVLRLGPRPERPRRLGFRVWPHGAPVWLEGTRDGRGLRAGDVRIAAEGRPASAFPFLIPDVDAFAGPFSPPSARQSGVSLWFAPIHGASDQALDRQAREALRALGYLK